MKKMKKVFALLLAVVMSLSMMTVAFAANEDPTTYTITVTNQNTDTITIEGRTYNAYKVFDLSYSGTAYSYTLNADFAGNADLAGLTHDGKSGDDLIEYLEGLEDDSDALFAFADDVLAYVTANNIAAAGAGTVEEGAESVTITVPGAGYYLVTGDATATDDDDVVTAACVLTTTSPSASVNVKADAPQLDKEIVDADAENGNGDAKDVGDKETFKLTSNVPDMTGYDAYTYIVHDTMTSGLTFNNDVAVTVGGEEYTAFTVATENIDGKTFVITFTDFYANLKDKAGAEIVITYSATINENALTTDKEKNTANLEYSSNPDDDTTNHTPDSDVYVFDFDIEIDKYVKGATGTKLAGAKFVLTNSEGEYYTYDEENKKVVWVPSQDDADVVETDENGFAEFVGVDAGSYQLIETEAPEGYNKLDAPIDVEITATYNEDGTLATTSATVGEDNGQYYQTASVENSTGSMLPSTGGAGTTMMYIIGAILVIGAGVVLITKRRMVNE